MSIDNNQSRVNLPIIGSNSFLRSSDPLPDPLVESSRSKDVKISLEIEKQLFDSGYDMSCINSQDKVEKIQNINQLNLHGISPLMHAAAKGDPLLLIALLFNGADLEFIDEGGKTAIFYSSDVRTAELLIKKGAKLDHKDVYKRTFMFYAVWKKKYELVDFCLQKGADINDVDSLGQTPIFVAAIKRNIEMMEFLLRKGAVLDLNDRSGQTPLYFFSGLQEDHKELIIARLKEMKKEKVLFLEFSKIPELLKAPDGPVLMLGELKASFDLSKVLKPFNISVQTDVFAWKSVFWGRDCRVVLSDGSHLIPYPLPLKKLNHKISMLIPKISRHLVQKGFFCGNGFTKSYVKKAIQAAKFYGIKANLAKTCIEGGNCFINKDRAVVGNTSVVTSLLALEDQNYFSKELLEKKLETVKKPRTKFVRMARNREVYVLDQSSDDKIFPKGVLVKDSIKVKKLLKGPISKEEKKGHFERARALQAKWEITLDVMAEELKVKRDNLIIAYQNDFHIDMEMAVIGNGEVLLDDPKKTKKILRNLVRSKRKSEYFKRFQKEARKNIALKKKIVRKNLLKFESSGFKVARVPAVYTNGKEPVNFVNGVFFNRQDRPIFLTNGTYPEAKILKKRFSKSLIRTGNSTDIIFSDPLARVLKSDGGLRCLSWKKPS